MHCCLPSSIFPLYIVLILFHYILTIYRTGNVSRCVAEPHKKNLFLQSLAEEDQQNSALYANDPDKEKSSQKQIQDKDRVECLESGVKFWTDFSKVHYHPRSLYELDGSWTDVQKFDNYGIGKDVLSAGLQIEEMSERLRFFVEECDHIQVLQHIQQSSQALHSTPLELRPRPQLTLCNG